jgi:hyperosmotically inducible periplasmic protein
MNTPLRIGALAMAIAATLAMGGCDKRSDDKTVGQKVDGVIAKVENAGEQAKQATADAGASMSASAKDMAITTKINAALAADDKLSAIRIDVDTQAGQVKLAGTAPDAASRDRATKLAAAVEGVSSVDNRLSLK